MTLIVKVFFKSIQVIKQDKYILFLSLIPVFLGSLIYFFLGKFLYGDILEKGSKWVESTVNAGEWGSVIYYVLMILLTILMYFIVSWTFVLIVSVIASPFNDILSSRVEKLIFKEQMTPIKESFLNIFKNLVKTILNELKKIVFIVFITLISFSLSFIPILVPISLILSGLLISANFLDYSWSRHELSLTECLSSIRKSFIENTVAGLLFMTLLSIPLVNIFCLPFAVIYFTILYHSKDKIEI